MRKTLLKEINVFQKPRSDTKWRIGLIYPNSYTIGMSGLSVKLLYHLLNQHQNIFAERIFFSADLPGPPRSIETRKILSQFDILAFSFQFELDYINAIRMLQRSNIPVYANERVNDYPLLLAGGPTVTTNSEPILDIFDALFAGDFESVSNTFLQAVLSSKFSSLKEEILTIPGFFSTQDIPLKRILVRTPNLDEVNYPVAQVRPIEGRVKKKGSLDGFFLQVSRGCPHKCHFCLIGKIFQPYRERSITKLKNIIYNGSKQSQTDFFSLIGSGTADYSQISDLITYFISNNLKFTLPSIRIDSGIEVLDLIRQAGQRNLTIAPESGSEDIRRNIGKKIRNEQILEFVQKAHQNEIQDLKLYFILGLTPDPYSESIEIINLVSSLIELKTSIKFNVSITPMIPKYGTKLSDHTVNYFDIQKGMDYLKQNLREKVRFKSFPIHWAAIQALLSMGGREITPKVIEVAKYGGSYSSWKKVLKINPISYYLEYY
ncbi:MAG: B12-binding domain-containing radical SAM protein [Candidatus Hodarchaeota archaeon]